MVAKRALRGENDCFHIVKYLVKTKETDELLKFPDVLWIGVVARGVDAVEELLYHRRVHLAVLLALQVLSQLLDPQFRVRFLK